MTINQIALLLEIIGFLLASFFIAMLKIGVITSMADKVKASIIASSERTQSLPSQIQLVLVWLILLGLVRRMTTARFPKDMKPWKYPLFLLHVIIFIYLIPIVQVILFLLVIVYIKGLDFMAERLAGRDVITNFLIILGTLMVFTGLILELIATW